MGDDLMWRSAVEQAALVRAGEVSALELVDAAIARLEATRALNAVIHQDVEGARARAASGALATRVAGTTAWTVQRYEDAGLAVLGRTNTPEFGNHGAAPGRRSTGWRSSTR
jgi:amidase